MTNMKNEANSNNEFTELIKNLYKLRIELLKKDEKTSLWLFNITCGKYITSDHTNEFIYLFLGQIQKNLLS